MQIDEAIKTLNCIGGDGELWPNTDIAKALKLGIEALKRVQDIRSRGLFNTPYLLPGEDNKVK